MARCPCSSVAATTFCLLRGFTSKFMFYRYIGERNKISNRV
jgi:hypothetical protein